MVDVSGTTPSSTTPTDLLCIGDDVCQAFKLSTDGDANIICENDPSLNPTNGQTCEGPTTAVVGGDLDLTCDGACGNFMNDPAFFMDVTVGGNALIFCQGDKQNCANARFQVNGNLELNVKNDLPDKDNIWGAAYNATLNVGGDLALTCFTASSCNFKSITAASCTCAGAGCPVPGC